LQNSCPATYAKTVELLCTNWLKSTRFDPILLLERLNPVLNESACEEVARVLLSSFPSLVQAVLKRRGIVVDRDGDDPGRDVGLSPGMALFLRVKCEQSSSSDAVTDIIADVPTLCILLNSHIDKLIEFNNGNGAYADMDDDEAVAYEDEQNLVCLQLIHMAHSSEIHREEGNRRHFVSIMRRILTRPATPDDLVEACMKAMASAHIRESQFLQTISEILVDVEDNDTFQSKDFEARAIVIVRQMRIIIILSIGL
jgi:hypothetical protein